MVLNTLVAPLGEAPAVVIEALEELGREGVGIDKVVALYTTRMLPSFVALKIAMERGPIAGRVGLSGRALPFDDVRTTEDCRIFRSLLHQVVKEEGERGATVRLLISGGRKSMVVDATLVALANGLREVYHLRLPAGSGAIPLEPLLSSYQMELYLESDPPPELIKRIVDACYPRLGGGLLIRIPLPQLALAQP